MADRPRWLAAGVIAVGVGTAAMFLGSGVAAANTGASGHNDSISHSAVHDGHTRSKMSSTKVSAGKSPRAVISGARTTEAVPAATAAANAVTKTTGSKGISPAPVAVRATSRQVPSPAAAVVLNMLSALGLSARPESAAPVAAVTDPVTATSAPAATDGVTGVKVGHSDLKIPVGSSSYTAKADWYFPTQADGSVDAKGVIYLQHGFLGLKSWYSALAKQLALQTDSVVVVPNVPWFQLPWNCSGCSLNGAPMAQGVAGLFADPDRTWLTTSADAAGYTGGALPQDFVLTGHSAGGGLATSAGGFYTAEIPADQNHLLGVVMYDGVASSSTTFANALASLDARNIPVYTIAAPPQSWNANGQTTKELVSLRPGQFVGDTLANGSHVDSLIGGNWLADIASQLIIKRSPPGNTQAVYTLAAGWIDDFYAGNTPTSPGPKYGIYGAPDQFIVMGPTAAVVLGPPPVVNLNQYSGTWYEVGSVKQFFSIGLVNTKAVYTPLPNGSIKVENSGNYFFNNGPQSTIVGNAVSLNADNNKLNVSFLGPAKATQPGNYWIVDLALDYSWAVVTDPSGLTGFLLSRTPTVSGDQYRELLDRASVKGVKLRITPTRQPQAATAAVAV